MLLKKMQIEKNAKKYLQLPFKELRHNSDLNYEVQTPTKGGVMLRRATIMNIRTKSDHKLQSVVMK